MHLQPGSLETGVINWVITSLSQKLLVTFLYGPAFHSQCTPLPSSCFSRPNIQDNVPQANLAYFISHCGLAVKGFGDED